MAKGSGTTKSQGANSASAGRTIPATQSGLPSNIPASEVEATKGWIDAVDNAWSKEKVTSLKNTVEKMFGSNDVSYAAAKAVIDAAEAKLPNLKAGFSKEGQNYTFNHDGAEVTVHKPYTAGNGQKYYSVDIKSGDNSYNGSFSQNEVQKLTSMSPQKLSSAVKGYIKDSFDKSKAKNQGDVYALQKKYFGI